MPTSDRPVIIATRGSPLALAQAQQVLARCRSEFPELKFEIRIVKTTGDQLQKSSMAHAAITLPKGLFTKELEAALLGGSADLAVHSLKDLPTELPAGLRLGAVLEREDPRDVLICRSAALRGNPHEPLPNPAIANLPRAAIVATSSPRRKEQLLALRPDLKIVEIRGNVGTRLQKLADSSIFSATILAAAGLHRLGYRIKPDGAIECTEEVAVPVGLSAVILPLDEVLPCVGQAAIGLEMRQGDPQIERICKAIDHLETHQCVAAERAFLRAMGGGCQSPVAAYAELSEGRLRIRGVSFRSGPAKAAQVFGPTVDPESLGSVLASKLAADVA